MKATMPPTLPVSYLCVLFLILSKARREGLMSIEEDIEEFAQSSIFLMFPELQSKPLYFEFLRDVLRLMVSGTLEPRLIKMYTDASERALLKTKKPDIVLFDVIRTTLLASVNECPPQIAVDFGRQAIPFGERPSFIELEQLLKICRYKQMNGGDAVPPLEIQVAAWFERMRKNDSTGLLCAQQFPEIEPRHTVLSEEEAFRLPARKIALLDDRSIQSLMREVNYHDLKAFLWYMGDEDMVKQVLFNMTTREAEQMFEDMETLYQHLNLDKVPQQYAEKGRAATLRITETLYYMIKEGIIKSI